MGLKQLKEKLEAEAEGERSEILSDAEKQAGEIVREYGREVEDVYQDTISKVVSEGEGQAKGVVGRAKVQATLKVSEAKKKVLERVYTQAEKEVKSLPEKKKKKLLEGWLKDSGVDLKDYVVKTSPEGKRILGSKALVDDGFSGFGFMLEKKDGSVVMDYRLQSVLEGRKPVLNARLNKLLWG